MIHQLKSKPTRRFLARLFLPVLFIAAAGIASAATVDTGDISTQASAFLTLFMFIGAVAAVAGIVFSALAIRGRNIGEGILGVLCAVAAIFIIGHASAWVSSITGVSVGGG